MALSLLYQLAIPFISRSFISSFTAECFAIIEALNTISSLPPNKYLVATDSLSCLQALSSNVFNLHPSPVIITIRHILFPLRNLARTFNSYGYQTVQTTLELRKTNSLTS
ncbi:RNA-directed DNA polymerase from mobile element jockey [Aphis craccivora]|uniref:RNA-directed DNA polymerase from mobile element jockey n=1 Tax=Aphis craccivora TaxID=307492 RepID=A0A6G0YST8_APHCR|nr:RNA-directed DNA polymerase from mobile element jockey [Aphis craccivora]